jgi:hypothetical protein
MTIYAILLPNSQPALAEEIKRVYPTEHLAISDTQWLISSAGSIGEVAAKLGVYDPSEPTKAVGNAVLVTVSSYTGRASPNIWNWLKTKMESPPSG